MDEGTGGRQAQNGRQGLPGGKEKGSSRGGEETREERERRRKEAHTKELEARMVEDLEREWQEIAKQRKLQAEVSAGLQNVSGVHMHAIDSCYVLTIIMPRMSAQ